jgi:Chromo (CHRromatin Organisation MOdifier) domain
MEPLETKALAVKDFMAMFKKVTTASEAAKRAMKLQANKHHTPAPDFQVGQQVWLSMDNLCMLNRPLKKLLERWIGPYEVLWVAPGAVELKLPKSPKVHPVVNVSWVKPYLGPLPGQPVSCPGPVHITEECNEEYEVDYIVNSWLYKGKFQYLVHWKGYSNEERTWEPPSHLRNAPDKVAEFRRKHPSAPCRLQIATTAF